MNKTNWLGEVFSEEDLAKIIDLLKNKDFSGWFGNNTGGPYMREFERKWADFCGVKYAIATSSGSSAIYNALRACGVGRGDVVAVPTYTHIGSVAPIIMAQAKPYFVDVEPKFGLFDPEELKKAPKLKAIIPVHYLGMPCEMNRIKELAKDAYIIEDASQGLGSEYYGKKVGVLGDIAGGSIGGGRTKIVCAGEGGMITTNNEELAERARNMRNHGDRYADKNYFGFSFRMSELNALVVLLQFNRINKLLNWEINNAEYLIKRLPFFLESPSIPNYIKPNRYFIGCHFSQPKVGMPRDTFLNIIRNDPELKHGKGIPRRCISGGSSKLISDVRYYQKWRIRDYPVSKMFVNKAVWIDWHRFPRTKKEIDELLACFEKVIEV